MFPEKLILNYKGLGNLFQNQICKFFLKNGGAYASSNSAMTSASSSKFINL
jgi:hypothetical protein